MSKIYKDAIDQQGDKGASIFLTNLIIAKHQTFGASKRIKKEFFHIKKIVASGTLKQIQNSPTVLLACLVKLYGKEKAFKTDRSKYFIEDEIVTIKKDGAFYDTIKTEAIEIISFHGYSFDK
jgi:hypothetical protein